MIADALAVLAGYLLGSMPWGYWLPCVLIGVDMRTQGSGNPGATNVWRVLGFRWGLPVALLDLAKGLAAALVGRWVGGDVVGVLAGFAAMAGHWRPLFLKGGKGGKMVATTGGIGLGLATFASLSGAGVWIVVFLVTRYASVASMVSAATLPLFAILFGASWSIVAFTVAAAVGIVLLHRANIVRLFRGTENRFELRRRRAAQSA